MQHGPSLSHSIRHIIAFHQKVTRFVLDNSNLSLLDIENFGFYRRNPHLSSNPKDISLVHCVGVESSELHCS